MKKATLHIIQGFLGAGKTTFSKKLSEELNAVHLNPDEWCMKLFKREEYENNWEQCFDKTLDVLWKKTSEYLNGGSDVVFDMGFWDRKSRDYAKAFAKQNNADFKHYYIYAPDDILRERIALRSGQIAENNVKNFDEIKKKYFCAPEQDEDIIVINNW